MAKKKTKEPKVVRPDDIDPGHNWSRPLQAPGHIQVDFEERVNFRRLHDYRIARLRAALAACEEFLPRECSFTRPRRASRVGGVAGSAAATRPLGSAARSWRVYGCCGRSKMSAVAPLSTISPCVMTQTRSAM